MACRWWTIPPVDEGRMTEPVALASSTVHRFHVLNYLRLLAFLSVASFHYITKEFKREG